MQLTKFTFNGFQENTYVLYDKTGECVIVDPGCYEPREEQELSDFITSQKLTPKILLNTHFHLDHIFGNQFVSKTYGLTPTGCRADLPTLQMAAQSAQLYGFGKFNESPEPGRYIDEGDQLRFGETQLEIYFTPGHAPGHIIAVHHNSKTVIGGDVLFSGSVGRTDLPGGNFTDLATSIKKKLYTLPDDYTVYCGHGPETTIGKEKKSNPFVSA